MPASARARREDGSGFTLVELMAVVLIIAIPTFLGAKSRAQNQAAYSSLRTALTNAKGIDTDPDSSALLAAKPSLSFGAAATSAANNETRSSAW